MPNLIIKDASGANLELAATGEGTALDPIITRNTVMPDLLTDRTIGTAASKVVKGSAGRLFAIRVVNLNNANTTCFFQLFNTATTPNNGAAPVSSDPVYPGAGLLVLGATDFGMQGTEFSTGITWGFSTTPLVFTAGVATDAIVTVRYV